jgi:branched-chain amino acid transport system substrate-binding protein
MVTRRAAVQVFAALLFGLLLSAAAARAADQTVKVGINLSLTGADAAAAKRMRDAALLAFDGVSIPGIALDIVTFDDGTATAGEYDPAQAAINARRMGGDKDIVAAIGPQMSGAGKAMAPILSQSGLATITPSSTNPDITDPGFAAQFRPGGKTVFFRTVTTDDYQGPNLANFLADTLHAKRVFVLDDSGAYGVGMADAFQEQATRKGIVIAGRDKLDTKAADYSAVLTRIKSLGVDALYYGGVSQAGVKVAKQGYEIIPTVIKAAGDGMYAPDVLSGAGFPAAEGWYVTIASPHELDNPATQDFVNRYKARFNELPDDAAMTTYDAALVIIDAVTRVAAGGKPVTREAVRQAIQTANVATLQGVVSFDENGDLKDRTVSVFQIRYDSAYPPDDVVHQFHYIGVAPPS